MSDVAAAIRASRSAAISAADRAVLGNGDWRERSAADNARLVAEAVLEHAASIAEGFDFEFSPDLATYRVVLTDGDTDA